MKSKLAPYLTAGIGAFILATCIFYDLPWLFPALALMMLGLGLIIWKSNQLPVAYLILIICLPISIEIEILKGFAMHLPSEFITGSLIIAFFLGLLNSRKENSSQLHLSMLHPNPQFCSNQKTIENPRKALAVFLAFPIPLLWIASFFIPVLFSEMTLISIKFLIVNAAYVTIFYYGGMAIFTSSKQIETRILLYCMAFLPLTFWGWYNFQVFEYNPVTLPGIFRPFYRDHTIFGAVAAMIFGFSLGLSIKNKYWILIALLAIFAVLLSGSRAATISLSLPIIGVFMYYFPKLKWAIPLMLIGASVYLFPNIKNDYTAKIDALDSRDPSANLIERTKSVRNLETDASNIERLNRWTAAWKMFLEKPHTGFGPGTYQYTYIPFQEQKFENHLTVKNPDNPPPGSGGSAHSEIMLQLSENGWPSTALFVFLVLRWIIIGLQKLQTKNHVLIACWLGLLTYLFHMQFNNFLNTDAFAFLFWTFGAGIDLSIYQTRKNEQPILQ